MKASLTDSRATATSAGSPPVGTARASGIGSSQVASVSGAGSGVSALWGPLRSIGRARRWLALFMFRQTFVAIRYSHERNAARPSNASSPRHARTNVSWTASSASNVDPSIR